ncbi:MerR family transcriptional regulator [Streptosporangium sp. NPDC020145]|uniref:MerR family transcriptional regulator n=1 Tax=Streptosporangium sp. NPDC020145 TaxID=3154694 RepID=UPI003418D8B4
MQTGTLGRTPTPQKRGTALRPSTRRTVSSTASSSEAAPPPVVSRADASALPPRTASPGSASPAKTSSERGMKIGELARETGVSVRLLRYYEEQGLLTSHRSASGHRHYTAEAPTVVGHIRVLLAAGLPTRTIRDILPCIEGPGPDIHPCVQNYLRTHLEEIETQITTLQRSRSSLTNLLTATENFRTSSS